MAKRTEETRTRVKGIIKRNGYYHIRQVYLGVKLTGTTKIKVGEGSLAEAEAVLERRKENVRALQLHGSRPDRPFIMAAEEYCARNEDLDNIDNIVSMLDRICNFYLGDTPIKDLHNDHPQIKKMRHDLLSGDLPWDRGNGQKTNRPRKQKTVNTYIDLVSRVLRAAAYSWRDENGNTWLQSAPKFDKKPLTDKRPPKPISWDQQDLLCKHLAPHLIRLAVYDINSGLRDREILNLRTTWKADVAGMSDVYVIPGYWTDEVTGEVFKVTKNGLPRVHIPNKICRSILSDCIKLMDPEAERPVIFTYRKQPITRVTNTGWKKARAKAGMKDPYLSDLHFHDLRHTFGHRLREAGVGGPDRDTLLGHVSGSLTDHYSQADIRHLKSCVEKITKRSNAIPVLSVASIFK